ncbi:MAG: hypothetical protein RLZZ221_3045 [Verrucomicrobiota bacterium]
MLTALTDRNWLWVAAGFYLAGFLQGTISLVRQGKPAGVATYVLILLGYAAQLAGLVLRGRSVGGCPLGNPLEIYQFTAWSTVTLYLVIGATFRLSLLGYFSACLAATLTLLYRDGQQVVQARPGPEVDLRARHHEPDAFDLGHALLVHSVAAQPLAAVETAGRLVLVPSFHP